MKKILCVCLSIILVLGLLPVGALAAEPFEDEEPLKLIHISWMEDGERRDWHSTADDPAPEEAKLPTGVTVDDGNVTLNGADLSFIEFSGWGDEAVTVTVNGTNTISCGTENGINFNACHNATITGGGTLSITVHGGEEGGWYGTPLSYHDFCVKHDENYNEGEAAVHEGGHLKIEGVTLDLHNPNHDIEWAGDYAYFSNNTSAMDILGNVELGSGASVTCESADATIFVRGNMTIASGAKLSTSTFYIQGVNSPNCEGDRITALTVNGKLDVTGALDMDYPMGLVDMNVGAGSKLVLNEDGSITIDSHSASSETGLNMGAAFYDDRDGSFDTSVPTDFNKPSQAEISGGTLTVNAENGIVTGISVQPGVTWTQTGGKVSINTTYTSDGENADNSGVGMEIFTNSWFKDKPETKVEISGGELNIDTDIESSVTFFNGIQIMGDSGLDISGDASVTVDLDGVTTGWTSLIDVRGSAEYDPEADVSIWNPDAPGTIKVSGGSLTLDASGLTGEGEEASATGINMSYVTEFNVSGGTVKIDMPTGDIPNSNGINALNSDVNITGGDVTVTTAKTGSGNQITGVFLGVNGEDVDTLPDGASFTTGFTQSGGKFTVNLSAHGDNATGTELYGMDLAKWAGDRDATVKVALSGGETNFNIKFDDLNNDPDAAVQTSRNGINMHNDITETGAQAVSLTVSDDAKLNLNGEMENGNANLILMTNSALTQTGGVINITNETFQGTDNSTHRGLYSMDNGEILISGGELNIEGNFKRGLNANRTSMTLNRDGKVNIDLTGASETVRNSYTGVNFNYWGDFTLAGNAELNVDVAAETAENIIKGRSSPVAIDFHTATLVKMTGGKLNINQKNAYDQNYWRSGMSVALGFYEMGDTSSYFGMLGGEINIRGTWPLSATYFLDRECNLTFGDGINAVYADEGESKGKAAKTFTDIYDLDEDVKANGIDYVPFNDKALDDYLNGNLGDGKLWPEFNLSIKQQNAAPAEYSGSLELVNAGKLTAGNSYTVKMTAAIPEGSGTLTVTLSAGMTLEGNKVNVNGKDVEVTVTDGKFTVEVNSGDVIRFNVILANGENTVTAKIDSHETHTLTLSAEACAIEVPSTTRVPNVTVTGTALPDSSVTVLLDGETAKTVKANKSGTWSAELTLTPGRHTVSASITKDSQTYTSEEKTVVYSASLSSVGSLRVENTVHGRTLLDEEKVSFLVDYRTGRASSRYYTYWPELPEFTFEVTFENGGTPSTVADVCVVVTDWKGVEVRVPLTYDRSTGKWVGKADFCDDGHIIPQRFRVEYRDLAAENAEDIQQTMNVTVTGIGDPSGYVFEGLETNRLEGVEVSIYNKTNSNTPWPEAEDFDQDATLHTDAMGQYLWMVPDGEWQVSYSKAGYTGARTEWMEVPPVRTGLNQNMTSDDPAVMTVEYDEELGMVVLRFSKPVQVRTLGVDLQISGITVPEGGWIDFPNLGAVDAGWSVTENPEHSTLCATTFTFNAGTVDIYDGDGNFVRTVTLKGRTVTFNGGAVTYMGTDFGLNGSVKYPGSASGNTPGGGGGGAIMPPSDPGKTDEPTPSDTTRPGVVSPAETGIDKLLNVTDHIAYIEGDTAGNVMPDKSLTRAEAAQMLYKLLKDRTATTETVFTDVSDTAWYHDAAYALAAAGAIKGKGSEDTFAPLDTVTRAEFAAMCARLAKDIEAENPFTDVPANHWAAHEIAVAAGYGWINGRGNGLFDPSAPLTRAEAVKIINCMIARAPAPAGSATSFKDLPANHWACLELIAASTAE